MVAIYSLSEDEESLAGRFNLIDLRLLPDPPDLGWAANHFLVSLMALIQTWNLMQ